GHAPPPAPRWDQDWFPRLDAAAAYTMVRTLGPKRIVEVGCGHSTRFMARAVADGRLATSIIAIDPAPRAKLEGLNVRWLKQEVLQNLCRRLIDQGLPLYRVAVFVRTLHPNAAGRAFVWHERRNMVEVITAPLGMLETEQYLKSPVYVVFTEHVEIRRRIEGS